MPAPSGLDDLDRVRGQPDVELLEASLEPLFEFDKEAPVLRGCELTALGRARRSSARRERTDIPPAR